MTNYATYQRKILDLTPSNMSRTNRKVGTFRQDRLCNIRNTFRFMLQVGIHNQQRPILGTLHPMNHGAAKPLSLGRHAHEDLHLEPFLLQFLYDFLTVFCALPGEVIHQQQLSFQPGFVGRREQSRGQGPDVQCFLITRHDHAQLTGSISILLTSTLGHTLRMCVSEIPEFSQLDCHQPKIGTSVKYTLMQRTTNKNVNDMSCLLVTIATIATLEAS
mmetsp:Transcript_10926/g.17901  ORF Transcript_10926/g.17901 Transcript_10926/m.17901 type:complete len:217 (+) Transcript_10926:417-1067(+)